MAMKQLPTAAEVRKLAQHFSWHICGGTASTPEIERIHESLLQFAEMLERERWIPVAEGLPLEGLENAVLVWSPKEGFVTIGYMFEGKWLFDALQTAMEEVTHWRPLPAPPEGE